MRTKEIEPLIRAGQMMSNLCFNLCQRRGEPLADKAVASMKECQRAWDEALAALRMELATRKAVRAK